VTSTSRRYFDDMYDGSADPWGFESSAYEQRKYALTDACLPKPRYRAAFEPGCSVGVLSEILARRCDHLLATDIIPAALAKAATRLADQPHVVVEERAIPEDWPSGQFDLVMLSEIAYYFDEPDLRRIMALVHDSTPAGAHVVGVHWRGRTDYPLSGDRAHEIIDDTAALRSIARYSETEFLLQVWERA
jgi:predicted TPR repeat methyltransferase